MKCKHCGYDVPELNNGFCPNCKQLVKVSNSLKSGCLMLFLFVMLIFTKSDTILLLLLLCLFVNAICFIVFAVQDYIRLNKCVKNGIPRVYPECLNISGENKNNNDSEKSFKSFFLSSDKYRKKDDTLERGECEIEFTENEFIIKQGENKIENLIDSIYFFDIWTFKDDTYFKFRMRDLNELKFRSDYFEADKISKLLETKDVKIEDNRD